MFRCNHLIFLSVGRNKSCEIRSQYPVIFLQNLVHLVVLGPIGQKLVQNMSSLGVPSPSALQLLMWLWINQQRFRCFEFLNILYSPRLLITHTESAYTYTQRQLVLFTKKQFQVYVNFFNMPLSSSSQGQSDHCLSCFIPTRSCVNYRIPFISGSFVPVISFSRKQQVPLWSVLMRTSLSGDTGLWSFTASQSHPLKSGLALAVKGFSASALGLHDPQ